MTPGWRRSSRRSRSARSRGRSRTTVVPSPRGTETPPSEGAAMLSNSWRRCFFDFRPRRGRAAGAPEGTRGAATTRTATAADRRSRRHRGGRHRERHRRRSHRRRHRDRRTTSAAGTTRTASAGRSTGTAAAGGGRPTPGAGRAGIMPGFGRGPPGPLPPPGRGAGGRGAAEPGAGHARGAVSGVGVVARPRADRDGPCRTSRPR